MRVEGESSDLRDRARPDATAARILICADGESTQRLLCSQFESIGVSVEVAGDGEIAWNLFQHKSFEIVVTDLEMPKLDGIGLTRRIRSGTSRNASVPILLVTAIGTLSSAVSAGRAGVTDAFALDKVGIKSLTTRILELLEAERPRTPYVLLGSSPAITGVRERLHGVAPLDTPVLISGESGVGHSQAVAYLHAMGSVSDFPINRVDCTSTPNIETIRDPGFWHLDEVHELSREAQMFCYHWIEERKIGRRSRDVRLIASTTKDLTGLAARMAFLPDLARELCQFEIRLPPLRERRDDISMLICAILEVVGERIGRPGLGISSKAIDLLSGRLWWGNVVELMSVLESLAAFSSGLEISEAQAELVLVDSDPIVRAARERAQVERDQLLKALKDCRGNITHMAEQLKVDRGTIRYRLRKYGLHYSTRKFRDF